ncbi:MAG: flavodoxin family protein [Clostridia bacterium]|jgi:multimeric flavodoxin WrbA|nr:flavodoxin family protein [Clostridia bacterium]
MKILVIIGSLRKRNTYKTVKRIEEYHKEYSDFEYEYLFLKGADFKQCTGCFVCISHGEDKCPLKDDRDLIISKIENADGVILASPNYVMNVPWIMKNYIDRFAYTMHRPKFFDQYFMILVTSGSYMGTKQASKTLGMMASGGKIVTELKVFNSPGMNEKKKLKQDKEIEKKARAFYKRLSRKTEHRPPFGFLVWFSVFKATSSDSKTHLPADYNFYKDKKYFVDAKLNVFQKGLIGMFTGMFKGLVKMGIV